MPIHARMLSAASLIVMAAIPALGQRAANKRPQADRPAAKFTVEAEQNVMVPMRDGVRLATDIYRPAGVSERLPVILMRTPYNKEALAAETSPARFFAGQGYVVLTQDVRGRFHSEGEFTVEMPDAQDGYDAIDWASKQPWSTGKIGTFGCSYQGEVQYLSLKMRHPNHLAAIPQAGSGAVGPAGGLYKNFGTYEGGALLLGTGFGWFRGSGSKIKDAPKAPAVDLPALLRSLPIVDFAKKAGMPPTDFEDFVRHPPADAYWDQMHYLRDDDHFSTPALHIDSWFDVTPDGALEAFNLMRRNATNDAARQQYVIMSPTNHCGSENATEHTMVGAMDVGDARYSYWQLYLDWFDYWLKGVQNDVLKRPHVQYYVTGKNEWRTAPTWPPPDMHVTPYYPAPPGIAKSGRLTNEKPAKDMPGTYVYDPADPVPSKGGTICCTGDPTNKPGIFDQSALESRGDMLVFSTEPLRQAVTIAGPVKLVLMISSDAKDTDFAAKLIDVDSAGHAWNVVNGIQRVRYRDGMRTSAPSLRKDSTYRVVVSLKVTGHQFAVGDQIRLYVTSSDFPMYNRNLNTGGDNVTETTWVKATNTVHTGGVKASYLELPVVP